METTDFEWDLAAVIEEIRQPKETITAYLSNELSYSIAQLEEASALETDPDKVNLIDEQIKNLKEMLEKYKYVFEITGVPQRVREDIASKALAKYPLRLTGMYQDDNFVDRQRYERILIWQAQITGVTNPLGQTRKMFTEEEMDKFLHSLPIAVRNAVDAKIEEIRTKSEKYVLESKNLDF